MVQCVTLTAAPQGKKFLSGTAPLRYTAGGERYCISAGKQGLAKQPLYVPRCCGGSAGANLDAINRKLLLSGFHRIQSYNWKPHELPKHFMYSGRQSDWPAYLQFMRDRLD